MSMIDGLYSEYYVTCWNTNDPSGDIGREHSITTYSESVAISTADDLMGMAIKDDGWRVKVHEVVWSRKDGCSTVHKVVGWPTV